MSVRSITLLVGCSTRRLLRNAMLSLRRGTKVSCSNIVGLVSQKKA